ncbi:hypothetical protein DM02DRAFT_659161 [Periconia macrospinosa]|uniref:F-box domain-containing protein n=1 Tax=Periconia macrospinosa TaxID=97972 RepID=A0A2V1DGZ6_9PLEO|nr:hypothetical protein DM02DRAFT_659161 [Periconia macrospinosa]
MEGITYGPEFEAPDILTLDSLYSLYPHKLRLQQTPPPKSNIGELNVLPNELLVAILEQLPIQSLLTFRNVSTHARFVVDTLPRFRAIMRHAPQIIYANLVLQPSTHVSLSALSGKLRQKECDLCPPGDERLAPYIWIPTASRLCLQCLRTRGIPQTLEELQSSWQLDAADLAFIPSHRFPAAVFRSVCENGTSFQRASERKILYDLSFELIESLKLKTTQNIHVIFLDYPEWLPYGEIISKSAESAPAFIDTYGRRWFCRMVSIFSKEKYENSFGLFDIHSHSHQDLAAFGFLRKSGVSVVLQQKTDSDHINFTLLQVERMPNINFFAFALHPYTPKGSIL